MWKPEENPLSSSYVLFNSTYKTTWQNSYAIFCHIVMDNVIPFVPILPPTVYPIFVFVIPNQ